MGKPATYFPKFYSKNSFEPEHPCHSLCSKNKLKMFEKPGGLSVSLLEK